MEWCGTRELMLANLRQQLCGGVHRTPREMSLPAVAALVAVVRVCGQDEVEEHCRWLAVLCRLIRLVDLHSAIPELGQGPCCRWLAQEVVIAGELASHGVDCRYLLWHAWSQNPVATLSELTRCRDR